MQRAVVGQPWEFLGLIDAVDIAIRHHRPGPRLVVVRIVFHQDQLVRTPNHFGAGNDVNAGVVARQVGWPTEIVTGARRPADEQVAIRSRRRVGELADTRDTVRADRRRLVITMSEGCNRGHAPRREGHSEGVVGSAANRLTD